MRPVTTATIPAPSTLTSWKGLRLWGNVRTSKVDQSEYSLDAQKARLKAYATFRGGNLRDEDILVEEESAWRGKRKDFHGRLYADDWDVFLTARMDRAFRKASEALSELERIKKEGKNFVATDQNIDLSTDVGWITLAVLAIMAEWESRMLSSRSKLGHASSKAKGYRTLRRLPYGFEVVETRADGSRIVAPMNPQEFPNRKQKARYLRLV